MTATLTAKGRKAAERAESIERLRETLRLGMTVYTVLRHVAASGMSRDISLKVVKDGEIQDITWLAAEAMGRPCKERNGFNAIAVRGCGMDMGFHLVYSLSGILFEGNDKRADGDSGYCLNQRWL